MMTSYWLTNIGLGALVLLVLPMLRTAPPRLKMWMCIAATVAWCMPWPALALLWQSNDVFVQYVSWEVLRTLPSATDAVVPAASLGDVPWLWILGGLSVGGLCLFAKRLIANARQDRNWQRNARKVTDSWRRAGFPESDVPVYVVPNLENAFVSGYLCPRICLGEKQLNSPSLHSILLHELTHIRQHDNLILLLLTLLEDAFWWNPMLRILTSKARRYVELSCDQACRKLSPNYREHLADELLSREYRVLESKLINPISRSPGFNAFRIIQLATEASMKIRHVLLLALLIVSSVVLASNISAGDEAENERQIVTDLTVKTVMTRSDGAINTKSIKTEVIAEDEIKKMLEIAESADVKIETHMENDYLRVVLIESVDMAETLKVLAAFENTGLHILFSNNIYQGTGEHIFLGLEFRTPGQTPYNVQLAPNVGEWTGVTVGSHLLRIKPDLVDEQDQQMVMLSTEISVKGEQENEWDLVGAPQVLAAFDNDSTIQIGYQIGDGDPSISLTLTPRKSLN